MPRPARARTAPPADGPAGSGSPGISAGPPTQTAVTRPTSRRSDAPAPRGRPEDGRRSPLRSWLAWGVGTAIAVGVAVAVLITSSSHNDGLHAPRPHISTSTRAASTPSARAAPSPSPTHAASVVIHLAAAEVCWVELTFTGTGSQIYLGTVQAGTVMTWTEYQPVTMKLGNPAGIVLTVNGTKEPASSVNTQRGAPVTLSFSPGSLPS